MPAAPAPATTAGRSASTTTRSAYVDGLRALAAIHVLLNHCFLEVFPSEYGVRPQGVTRWVTAEMHQSGVGVALFVVLSGYGLAHRIERDGWQLAQGTRHFVVARARRLMPAYYAALALSLVLSATVIAASTGTHWDSSVPFDARDVAGHLLLMQDVVGDPYTISHPLWSLAITWHIYLAVPLMLIAIRRWGVLPVAVAMVVGGTLVAEATRGNGQVVLLLRSLQLFGAFGIGLAALALVRADGMVLVAGRARRPPWTALALACLLFWVAVPLDHVPFALGAGCLLVAMGTGSAPWLRAALGWRPLVGLGTISFSLYLVHGPIVHLVWLEILSPAGLGIGRAATFYALLALAPALAIAAAWVLYRLVERPSAQRRRRSAGGDDFGRPDADERLAVDRQGAREPDPAQALA